MCQLHSLHFVLLIASASALHQKREEHYALKGTNTIHIFGPWSLEKHQAGNATQVRVLTQQSQRQEPWQLARSKEELKQVLQQTRARKTKREADLQQKRVECHSKPMFSREQEQCEDELRSIEKSIESDREIIWKLEHAIANWPSGF